MEQKILQALKELGVFIKKLHNGNEQKIIQAFKELGTFVGGKFDTLIELVKKQKDGNANEIAGAVSNLKDVVSIFADKTEALSNNSEQKVEELQNSLQQASDGLNKVITVLATPKKTEENPKIIKGLQEVTKTIKGLKFPEQKTEKVDFTKLEKLLEEIKSSIATKEEPTFTVDFAPVIKAINNITLPKTMKLDEMQMRGMRSSGGGIMLGSQQNGEYHTSGGDGRQTVSVPGTAVALSSDQKCTRVDITAGLSNSNIVVVGFSTVVAALATRRGQPLYQGDKTTIFINNLNKIYVDGLSANDIVTFVFYD